MEAGNGNGDSEVQRTMLELLNQLDGFEASNKIKVWHLDPFTFSLESFTFAAYKAVTGIVCKCFVLDLQVLMATNRIDILDQALLRPGRIDRKIEFPNPTEEVSTLSS